MYSSAPVIVCPSAMVSRLFFKHVNSIVFWAVLYPLQHCTVSQQRNHMPSLNIAPWVKLWHNIFHVSDVKELRMPLDMLLEHFQTTLQCETIYD